MPVTDPVRLYGIYADGIVNIPAGNLTSSTVQAALYELQSDIDAINTDHGALVGLSDDDHVQYLLVSGTRAMGLQKIITKLAAEAQKSAIKSEEKEPQASHD